jgi:hypothetical protein
VPSETHEQLVKNIYNQMLTFPTKSDRAIARDLNLGHSTVSRYRKKLYVKIDYELSRQVSSKFLTHFQMASDYFMKQIENLEALKGQKKVIPIKTKDDFFIQPIPLDPLDILQIEKQQTELWAKIIFLCRQNEAIEVIKLIQNGELPALTN